METVGRLVEGSSVLIGIVMGLVEWFKQVGITGKASKVLSMALGLTIGGGYAVALLGAPQDFATWFFYGVYGLVMGLTAGGIYDLGQKWLRPPTASLTVVSEGADRRYYYTTGGPGNETMAKSAQPLTASPVPDERIGL